MLLIAVRKMLSNKWMLACNLIGAIITVAMLSSIPIYTEGIMQRMLTRDMEISQQDSGDYPGGYLISYNGTFSNGNEMFDSYNEKVSGIISKSIDLPILARCIYINAGPGRIQMPDTEKTVSAKVSALSGINEHIGIAHGRAFSTQKAGDAYEAIASEEAMKVLGLTLGNTYNIAYTNSLKDKDRINAPKIKIVGIYGYKAENDLYWFNDISKYKEDILIDFDLLKNEFTEETERGIYNAAWYYAYDYHGIKADNLGKILSTLDTHTKWLEKNRSYLDYSFQAEPILSKYDERAKKLSITLLVLQIPILLILAFYSFMVARFKIEFESNEIAIIKSRGGSSTLVFMVYLIESSIISIIALATGPLLGFYMCKVIGSSNGFLEFVQRSALPLSLSPKVFLYSIIALMFISACMLIPAIAASRTSIVLYKQKRQGKKETSLWKKFFIDLILLAGAFYGLYGYQRQQKVLFLSGIKGTELEVDPLLFLVSVLFMFGSGLLVLRLFPYMIRLIYKIGKRAWNPVMYVTFLSVGRTSGKEQFTMLFIILILSIGIFSSSSARTINKNIEEKVRYQTGADIVVKSRWNNNRASGGSMSVNAPVSGANVIQKKDDVIYYEPPFKPFTELNGVEAATRVLKEESIKVNAGNSNLTGVSLMAIIPNEFGKTAWFDSSLLPHHWYNYLNLMTDSPTAMLVSKAFKEELKLKEGDQIFIARGDQKAISGIIYAFVDYWPTFNPNRMIDSQPAPYFVVANLNYLHAVQPIEPYEVWLKKKANVTSNEIYKSMTDKRIELESRTDATELLVKSKNDPSLQGTNGSLTIGFIVTIVITIIGFLIYWIMSIRKRVLQFGVLRAMGLTSREIMGMITCEQILVTGTSVLAGVIIGSLASRIFVPMLQMVYSAEEQVPPFKVITSLDDYFRLFIIIAAMLLACFALLRSFITKINIGQAIKLGED